MELDLSLERVGCIGKQLHCTFIFAEIWWTVVLVRAIDVMRILLDIPSL